VKYPAKSLHITKHLMRMQFYYVISKSSLQSCS